MELCACGTGNEYMDCCGKYISMNAYPLTAEQLMRSRYVAYVKCEISYIIQTTDTSTRSLYNAKSIGEWASTSHWQKLEIISTSEGLEKDTKGYVEFKAYYLDAKNKQNIHHEYSTFKKVKDVWYFVEGKVYTV